VGHQVAAALIAHGFDEPIPSSLPVGRGTILLVRGWIAPRRRLRALTVALDDEVWSFEASGEVRFDRPTVEGRPPHGFFLPIPIASRRADTRARLRITAGDELLADQPIEFLPAERRTLAIDTPIAICLATYNPDSKLLARQLDSLRAQTLPDFTCIIHDDGSRLDRWAALEDLAHRDTRFRVFRSERNRGFYRNFEAALALVPSTTPYVALCDQDDFWYPDKLATTIAALDADPAAQLAYCDMRVVDRDGGVLAPSYWQRRRNNYRHLDTLFYANTVTGAASVLRGALLDAALPFPPEQGPTFHDHWLALCAFVAGGLAYVDRPLYDYTQHGTNVIGHSNFGALTIPGALARHAFNFAEMLVKPRQAWTNLWSMLAFYHRGYRRLHLIAETLRLRFPDMPNEVRDVVELFDDRGERALELMTRRHAAVLARGDTTDMAEFKMGMGMLLHRQLAPLLPPLVGWKDRVLRS
jgi:glycosyltransferase involved in cell wall biosynthesis